MELSNFITETLNSIVKGVKDAQPLVIEQGGVINPIMGNWDKDKVVAYYLPKKDGLHPVSIVKFDVAIKGEVSNEKKGKKFLLRKKYCSKNFLSATIKVLESFSLLFSFAI